MNDLTSIIRIKRMEEDGRGWKRMEEEEKKRKRRGKEEEKKRKNRSY
jgi:hypothetical protein